MPRGTSKTSSGARGGRAKEAEPSLPFEPWLVEQLKDPAEAAGYLEAVIEEGHEGALMLALRQVAMAHGGISAVARRAKLTREATYRILSKSGNPELRSLTRILAAAGLRLSVRPIGAPKAAQRRAPYRVSKRAARAGFIGSDTREGNVAQDSKRLLRKRYKRV
jgi:probable addiction module antidote protein